MSAGAEQGSAGQLGTAAPAPLMFRPSLFAVPDVVLTWSDDQVCLGEMRLNWDEVGELFQQWWVDMPTHVLEQLWAATVAKNFSQLMDQQQQQHEQQAEGLNTKMS